jgi:hypothetical protein
MKVMTKFEGSSIGIHCFEAYKVIVKRKIEKGGSTTSYIWSLSKLQWRVRV